MAPEDGCEDGHGAGHGEGHGDGHGDGRQTLALRLAARNRQRALRAARLARLRPPGAATTETAAEPVAETAGSGDDAGALEAFLRALTAGRPEPPAGPPVEPGTLLAFARPAAGDLDRLPGVGPGLVWALERAGLHRLADLAPLAPAELAARLGPLGRLVPAERWIAAARAAAAVPPGDG